MIRVVDPGSSPAHHPLELDAGQLIRSWESPDRIDIVRQALSRPSASGATRSFVAAEPLDREVLRSIHGDRYPAFLEAAWDQWVAEGRNGPAAMGFGWPTRGVVPTDGSILSDADAVSVPVPLSLDGKLGYYSFAADCSIVAGTWEAAAASAAAAQHAARLVANGEPAVLAMCRPPGHHAAAEQFGGYCYLNNAALAAETLRSSLTRASTTRPGEGTRIGILDIDYHHGNGTQSIFYHRDDVYFASLHADPLVEFPWFAGHAYETGTADGKGANRNEPLPHGTEFPEWSAALGRCLAWLLDAEVDALVVSVGVDTFVDDPISKFCLETSDFPVVGAILAGANLPTVLVLEGGYATTALGHNVAGVVEGFEGANPQ